jgi:hypothetical protein
MNKSIDLGKLQQIHADAVRNKMRLDTVSAHAFSAYERAISAMERAAKNAKNAAEAVDKARAAVLEAARTVTQG